MNLARCVNRGLAVALIASLLPLAGSASQKTVNPETIHRKVVERGAGKWICVNMKDGAEVVGRIASIEEQSFGIEPENSPGPTTIAYTNVERVRKAGSKGKSVAFALGIGAAGTVAMALIARHQMSSMNNQPVTQPGAR